MHPLLVQFHVFLTGCRRSAVIPKTSLQTWGEECPLLLLGCPDDLLHPLLNTASSSRLQPCNKQCTCIRQKQHLFSANQPHAGVCQGCGPGVGLSLGPRVGSSMASRAGSRSGFWPRVMSRVGLRVEARVGSRAGSGVGSRVVSRVGGQL